MVEEMLVARDIVVSYETVQQWALKFGQGPHPGLTFLRIAGHNTYSATIGSVPIQR
jgi:transposase-like protein